MPIDLSAITLTELRYVVAVADQRHFGRAARACFVSQPTLSAQIGKLERTLGMRIFERAPRSVHLTSTGVEIVARAREVLAAAERVVDAARGGREPLVGPLRLGAIPTLAPYYLSHIVRPLRRAFPKLELVFRELKTAEILLELSERRLDFGLAALPLAAPGLSRAPLFDEPFLLLVPNDHALAPRSRVRESDVAGERVLLLDEGHCLRDQALEICGDARAETDGDFRATSIETLRQMVGAGMGVTLLPSLALRTSARSIAIPFADPAPSRRIALLWRGGASGTGPRAAESAALAGCLREHIPEGARAMA